MNLTKMAISRTMERGKVYVWTDGEEIYVGDDKGNGLRPAPSGIRGRAMGYVGPGELDLWYWCLGGNVFNVDGKDG